MLLPPTLHHEPPALIGTQDPASLACDETWSFSFEPFLWVVSLAGDGSADSSPPVDISIPSDFPGELQGGFLLAVEAQAPHSAWSIVADGLYVKLADDEGSVQTETTASMLEVGGAYALDEARHFELLAGLRYVDLGLEVDLGAAVDANAGEVWIEPWLGARGKIPVAERFSVALRGDIGGFGLGSEFTWQAIATLGADLGDSWRIDLGYRALAIDFDDGGLEYDTIAYGPLIGVRWTP